MVKVNYEEEVIKKVDERYGRYADWSVRKSKKVASLTGALMFFAIFLDLIYIASCVYYGSDLYALIAMGVFTACEIVVFGCFAAKKFYMRKVISRLLSSLMFLLPCLVFAYEGYFNYFWECYIIAGIQLIMFVLIVVAVFASFKDKPSSKVKTKQRVNKNGETYEYYPAGLSAGRLVTAIIGIVLAVFCTVVVGAISFNPDYDALTSGVPLNTSRRVSISYDDETESCSIEKVYNGFAEISLPANCLMLTTSGVGVYPVTTVTSSAFSELGSSVTEITLPETITTVADDAFEGSDITTVTVSSDSIDFGSSLANSNVQTLQITSAACDISFDDSFDTSAITIEVDKEYIDYYREVYSDIASSFAPVVDENEVYVNFNYSDYSTVILTKGSDGSVTVEEDPFTDGETRKTENGVEYQYIWWTEDADGNEERITFPYTITESTNIYAKWVQVYTLGYVLYGGEAEGTLAADTYYNNGTITLPSATKTVGNTTYTFMGWYTSADFSASSAITEIADTITSNLTLYAKFLQNYTVTYDYGTTVNISAATEDGEYPAYYHQEMSTISLGGMSCTGYTFGGWYLDSDFTTSIASIAYGSMGDITLYAKWTPIVYDICYVAADLVSGLNDANAATYTVEDTISLADLSLDGYTFGGWYYDADFTSLVDNAAAIVEGTIDTVTLYAQWTLNTPDFNTSGTNGVEATYDGTAHFLTVDMSHAAPSERGISYTYVWTDESGTEVNKYTGVAGENTHSYAVTNVLQSGTYTCTVYATDGTYTSATVYTNLTAAISQREITITADDKEVTYGDVAPEYTYKVTSETQIVEGEEDLITSVINYSCSYKQYDDAKYYTITPSGSTDNYSLIPAEGTLTVKALAVTATATSQVITYGDDVSLTYALSYTESNVTLEDSTLIAQLYDLIAISCVYEQYKDAGRYDITLSHSETGNYSINLTDGTLGVNSLAVTVTAVDKSITYGDDAPDLNSYTYELKYTNGTTVTDATLISEIANAVSFTCSYDKYDTATETYAITPDGTDDNYEITFVNGTLTVDPLKVSLEWSVLYEDDLVYTGSGKVLTATVTNAAREEDNVTVISYDISGDYTNVTNDGFYYIATALSNQNYVLPTNVNSTTYIITPASITGAAIELANVTYTYNRSEQEVSYTVSLENFANFCGSDYTVENNTGTNAGTYTLTLTGTGNFTGEVSKEWGIEKADISTAEITINSTYTYNANTQEVSYSVSLTGFDSLSNGIDYDIYNDIEEDAGTYTLTLKGINNFTGEVTKDWTIAKADISSADITINDEYTYDGTEQTVSYTATLGNFGNNFTCDVEYNAGTNAGTYTLTLTGTGNFTGTVSKAWEIEKRVVELIWTTLSNDELVYTGEAKIIAATAGNVIDGDTVNVTVELTDGCDNLNVTTEGFSYIATAISDGNENCNYKLPDDVTSETYYITAASIESAVITITSGTFTYNGEVQTVSYTATLEGFGTEFTYYVIGETGTKAAEHHVVLTGTGNFTGVVSQSWFITKANMSSVTIEVTSTHTYSGSSQAVEYTVTLGDYTLISGTDYTVTSGDTGTNADTYTLTLTGTGNFTDSTTKTWTISQANMSSVTISDISTPVYNGSSQTVEYTVTLGDYTLTAGTDYTVTSGDTGTDASDNYTLTLTGDGNFTGTATQTWIISQANMSSVTISDISTPVYNGESQTVTYTVTLGDYTLTAGIDYTVSGDTSATAADTYKFTLTGAGNFTGTKTQTWAIDNADMSNVTINVTSTHTYSGSLQAVNYTVMLGSYTLIAGTDYTVSGDTSGTDAASDYTLIFTGTGNFTGTKEVTWAIAKASMTNVTVEVTSTHTYSGSSQTVEYTVTLGSYTLTAGTDYTVSGDISGTAASDNYTLTLTGNGNFTGTTTQTWTISQASLSDVSVSVGTYTYSGSSQTVTYTVKLGSYTLTAVTDYTVSGDISGTAAKDYTFTLTGAGNFTGTKTQTWTMDNAEMSNVTIEVTSTHTYSGSSQTVTYTVKLGSYTLTAGTDYTVSGDTTGTAAKDYSLTLTGAGNFKGTTTQAWTISQASMSDISVSMGTYTYSGSSQTVEYTVMLGSYILTAGTDYTVTSGDTSGTAADTYKFTLTGAGNFTDTKEVSWTISPATVTAPSVTTTSYEYTGEEITFITETSSLYTISNNNTQTDIGEYTITVTLNDTTNYVWSDDNSTDAKTYTFTIEASQSTPETGNTEGNNGGTEDNGTEDNGNTED